MLSRCKGLKLCIQNHPGVLHSLGSGNRRYSSECEKYADLMTAPRVFAYINVGQPISSDNNPYISETVIEIRILFPLSLWEPMDGKTQS